MFTTDTIIIANTFSQHKAQQGFQGYSKLNML